MILEATQGGDVAAAVELPPEGDFTWTLGRANTCNVLLQVNDVSRIHAKLSRKGPLWLLEDCNSTYGTYVGGERILVPTVVNPGEEMRFGMTCTARLVEGGQSGGGGNAAGAGAAGFSRRDAESAEAQRSAARSMAMPAPVSFSSPTPAPAPMAAPAPARAQAAAPAAAVRGEDVVERFKGKELLYSRECMALKKQLHEQILVAMNFGEDSLKELSDERTFAKLETCVDDVLGRCNTLPQGISLAEFRQVLMDDIKEYGPITPILRSPEVSEVMVNGPERVFVEVKGRLFETNVKFFDEKHLERIIKKIVEPLGRRIDFASPMVDARLPDGSRVNAVIPPLALDGASMTIRKFSAKKLSIEDLVGYGSMTDEMAEFLRIAVLAKKNILVSGGTGSGKTTLLNVLSQFIPAGERLVTIEDAAELKLSHRDIVRLEARPANADGTGKIAIRDLVVNALRMRPDRIIVGECRGPEALDMLQAMNTGHDGSLTTAHANSPRDALGRLENMVMMAGFDLPSKVIREQIASAIDLVVQQTRLPDGSRKVLNITEVTGLEGTAFRLLDVFKFERQGYDAQGMVQGYHTATGDVPNFLSELCESGAIGKYHRDGLCRCDENSVRGLFVVKH